MEFKKIEYNKESIELLKTINNNENTLIFNSIEDIIFLKYKTKKDIKKIKILVNKFLEIENIDINNSFWMLEEDISSLYFEKIDEIIKTIFIGSNISFNYLELIKKFLKEKFDFKSLSIKQYFLKEKFFYFVINLYLITNNFQKNICFFYNYYDKKEYKYEKKLEEKLEKILSFFGLNLKNNKINSKEFNDEIDICLEFLQELNDFNYFKNNLDLKNIYAIPLILEAKKYKFKNMINSFEYKNFKNISSTFNEFKKFLNKNQYERKKYFKSDNQTAISFCCEIKNFDILKFNYFISKIKQSEALIIDMDFFLREFDDNKEKLLLNLYFLDSPIIVCAENFNLKFGDINKKIETFLNIRNELFKNNKIIIDFIIMLKKEQITKEIIDKYEIETFYET